ncbi:MAG: endonuclease V, partial [Candidatus Latescibacterota bacterium]
MRRLMSAWSFSVPLCFGIAESMPRSAFSFSAAFLAVLNFSSAAKYCGVRFAGMALSRAFQYTGRAPSPQGDVVKVRSLHRWDLSYRKAAILQQELAPRIVVRGGPGAPRLVAGADLSYDARTDRLFAAVLLLDGKTLEVVEEATAEGRCRFPYIPGLLSFREAPLLLRAFRKLRSPAPDLVLIDGQGTAHPRGFGIACHVGLILERPTVGCAKSLLVGTHAEPGPSRGDHAPLQYRGRRIGSAL